MRVCERSRKSHIVFAVLGTHGATLTSKEFQSNDGEKDPISTLMNLRSSLDGNPAPMRFCKAGN